MQHEALTIGKKILGDAHPDVSIFRRELFDVMALRGRLPEAEAMIREEIVARKSLRIDKDRAVDELFKELVVLLKKHGKLPEAEAASREELAVEISLCGKEHVLVANSLQLLGSLLQEQGKLSEAEAALRDALAIREKQAPADWQTFLGATILGDNLIKQKRYSEGEAVFLAGLEGLKKRQTGPEGEKRVLAARGKWLLTHGRFEEADRDYARLVQLQPTVHWHWYYRGCLLAYLGREQEYREHCRAMLRQFADAADFGTIERTTKTSLLLTGGAGLDVGELARRAERARQLAPASPWTAPWTALLMGLADCRAERYEQAAAWLEKCRKLEPDLAARTVAADAYLAIARHRLGKEQEARTALERATRRADKDLPPADSGQLDTDASAGIDNWLIAQTALREAEATVLGRRRPATLPQRIAQ